MACAYTYEPYYINMPATFGNYVATTVCQISNIFIYLFSFIALMCSKGLRMAVPYNYIVLIVFTLSMSLMVGGWTAYLTPASVLMAFGVLALVLTCIFLAVLATPNMLKAAIGVLIGMFAAIMLELIITIPLMIAGAFEGIWILYCTVGVLISAGLIYIDLFIVMLAGKYAMDEYIYCALLLYIDIIRLLLYLLAIFGKGK